MAFQTFHEAAQGEELIHVSSKGVLIMPLLLTGLTMSEKAQKLWTLTPVDKTVIMAIHASEDVA